MDKPSHLCFLRFWRKVKSLIKGRRQAYPLEPFTSFKVNLQSLQSLEVDNKATFKDKNENKI